MYRQFPGPRGFGRIYFMVLCRAGRGVDLHARHHRGHRRQVRRTPAAAGHLPPYRRALHAAGRLVRIPGHLADPRGRGDLHRPHLHGLLPERGLLHADHRPVEYRGLRHPQEPRRRDREGFPADPRLRNRRVHRRHVVRQLHRLRRQRRAGCGRRSGGTARPDGRAVHLHAADRVRRPGTHPRTLRLHAPALPARPLGRPGAQIPGTAPRVRRLRALQAAEDGALLPLLDAAGRLAADHQRIRHPLYQQLRRDVAELVRRKPHAAGFRVAGLRGAVHPADSLLPQTLRHQDRDAHGDVRLGAAFRILRPRDDRERDRHYAALPLVHRLRRGLRLLQRLGGALRRAGGLETHAGQRPGALHADDKRHRRLGRHLDRRQGRFALLRLGGRLPRGTRGRLGRMARHVVRLCGLCAGRCRDLCPGLPLPPPPRTTRIG